MFCLIFKIVNITTVFFFFTNFVFIFFMKNMFYLLNQCLNTNKKLFFILYGDISVF